MKQIQFDLTVQEAEQILNALAAQPYAQVLALMNNLQSQATVCMKNAPSTDQTE